MRDFFRSSIIKGRGEEGRTNPLFPVKKVPRWKKGLYVFMSAIIPVGSGIWGYRFLSEPQFQYSAVIIEGAHLLDPVTVEEVVADEFQERAGLFFTRSHTLFFKESRLRDRLIESLPLEDATITSEGNTLTVAITEDIVMMLLHSGDAWLLIDLEGNILRPLTAEETLTRETTFPKSPMIHLKEIVDVGEQNPVISPEHLTELKRLDHGLKSLGLTPNAYELETRKDTWLSVITTEKPYEILVDLEKNIDDQLRILGEILTQHEDANVLSTLDLRFGNRVYMK